MPELKPSDYWRTHPEWHGPIIAALGGPAGVLDPCADADKSLPCRYHLTEAEDGLKSEWPGEFVFMNPPFSQGAIWMDRFYRALEKGEIIGGITLTLAGMLNNKRCWHVMGKAKAFCLPRGRVRFEPGHPELNGDHGFDRDIVFSAFGPISLSFAKNFGQYGRILWP